MFNTKRKLRDKITQMQYRIAELEERLCPCESHQWKNIGFYLTGGTGMGDEYLVEKYKCERCGKKTESLSGLMFG